MRLVTLLVLVLGMTAVAFAAPSTTNVHQYAQKPWNEISRQDGVRVTGDTVADPFIARRSAVHGHGQHLQLHQRLRLRLPVHGLDVG